MDCVYNLECIICLGGDKIPTQNPLKVPKHETIVTEYKQSWKHQVNAFGVDIQ